MSFEMCYLLLSARVHVCAIVDFLVLEVFLIVISCRLKAIFSKKLPRTVMFVPQSS